MQGRQQGGDLGEGEEAYKVYGTAKIPTLLGSRKTTGKKKVENIKKN
jgi:hypothetical protein